jgi:hypothetical protein
MTARESIGRADLELVTLRITEGLMARQRFEEARAK